MTTAENIAQVQENIAAACTRAGRDPGDITLIAVSKTHPAEALVEAAATGIQHFGENRVEEASVKIPLVDAQLQSPVSWHMIGHIQGRKAKDVPPLFDYVHSVDSVKLAEKLSRGVQKKEGVIKVLLEINISGEASKSGFSAFGWKTDASVRDALWTAVTEIAAIPELQIEGLMTMAPIVDNAEDARPVFKALAELRTALATDVLSQGLRELSMGMTDDYQVAVEEGATMVRVGRAIFGERRQ